MSFMNAVPAGVAPPRDINVIIEIPAMHTPIKYEVDKNSGALMVDRFMPTPMFYPANYGFVPNTLAGDGDPIDALVVTPHPLAASAVIRSRPVGVLKMSDEGGEDVKILCVPHDKLSTLYTHVKSPEDLPALLLEQIQHFFEHYKDLEADKWVRLDAWAGAGDAEALIAQSLLPTT